MGEGEKEREMRVGSWERENDIYIERESTAYTTQ